VVKSLIISAVSHQLSEKITPNKELGVKIKDEKRMVLHDMISEKYQTN